MFLKMRQSVPVEITGHFLNRMEMGKWNLFFLQVNCSKSNMIAKVSKISWILENPCLLDLVHLSSIPLSCLSNSQLVFLLPIEFMLVLFMFSFGWVLCIFYVLFWLSSWYFLCSLLFNVIFVFLCLFHTCNP